MWFEKKNCALGISSIIITLFDFLLKRLLLKSSNEGIGYACIINYIVLGVIGNVLLKGSMLTSKRQTFLVLKKNYMWESMFAS